MPLLLLTGNMTGDGSFEISMGYITSPELENRILILSDPMLATGSSMVKTIQLLRGKATPLRFISLQR